MMRRPVIAFVMAASCATPPAHVGVDIPITEDHLVGGDYVAFTTLWQVPVLDGDPVVFLADGTVRNERAGLAGRWAIVDDSTVSIQSTLPGSPPPQRFRVRIPEGVMISPETTSVTRAATFTIVTRGSMKMFSNPR
jgi:hypothetical protein